MAAQSFLRHENRVRRLGRLVVWNIPWLDVQKKPFRWVPQKEACLHFLGLSRDYRD